MHPTKLHSIVRSFIIIPLITSTLSMNAFMASVRAVTAVATPTVEAAESPEAIALQQEREEKAAKIDAYFAKYDMPLAGYGMKMVLESEKHNLDWRLIPAIAVRETTGGKFACKNNPFGYGSCKIGFKDYNQAIEVVTASLGGHNPATATYYQGKSVKGILQAYNPPSVVAKYADQVMAIMNHIEQIQIS